MAESEISKIRVSVVIPVFNGGDDLELCLQAVMASECADFECIVVDDGSTDGRTADIARSHGARLLEMEKQGGPALARNRGAQEASGDILFFTDADVVLHADALSHAVRVLDANPGVAAVFGSYDDRPGHPALLSRYRNLYHHWIHQAGNEEASTFWTGCGAVRRDVFLQLEGFSREYARPSIEDIEFGYRMRAAGHRIRLCKEMQGSHLKEWKLSGMVRTDLFQRGVPWVVLIKRFTDVPADLNLNLSARAATALAGIFCLFTLLLIPGLPWSLVFWPWVLVPLASTAGIAWIQRDFLSLLWRRHGLGYAAAGVPLQLLFFICCGLAVPLGYLHYWSGDRV